MGERSPRQRASPWRRGAGSVNSRGVAFPVRRTAVSAWASAWPLRCNAHLPRPSCTAAPTAGVPLSAGPGLVYPQRRVADMGRKPKALRLEQLWRRRRRRLIFESDQRGAASSAAAAAAAPPLQKSAPSPRASAPPPVDNLLYYFAAERRSVLWSSDCVVLLCFCRHPRVTAGPSVTSSPLGPTLKSGRRPGSVLWSRRLVLRRLRESGGGFPVSRSAAAGFFRRSSAGPGGPVLPRHPLGRSVRAGASVGSGAPWAKLLTVTTVC